MSDDPSPADPLARARRLSRLTLRGVPMFPAPAAAGYRYPEDDPILIVDADDDTPVEALLARAAARRRGEALAGRPRGGTARRPRPVPADDARCPALVPVVRAGRRTAEKRRCVNARRPAACYCHAHRRLEAPPP